MKFIRWLFRNIILVAFILALTYAYVYWDNLTGEDTPAGRLIAYLTTEYDEVREFLEDYDLTAGDKVESTPPPPATSAVATATVPQTTMPSQQPMQTSPPPAVSPQAMRQQPPRQLPARPVYPEMQQPVRPTYPEPQERPMRQYPGPMFPDQAMLQQPQPIPQMAPRPPTREPMPMIGAGRPTPFPEEQATMPMPRGQAPLSRAGEQPPAVAEPVSSTRELWISAREEYHRGNIDVSIRNYKEVIANSTDNYDAYGELGNVYLSRGSHKDAAEAYFEAAAILVKTGQIGRARGLLPMLSRLDRSKAEELNQLIQRVSG